jgi:hypothetical protein
MTARRILISLVLVLTLLSATVIGVSAQGATDQTWTSSITYYTPSATAGEMVVTYYASDGTPYSTATIPLDPHKAGSLLIGSVSAVPADFGGGSAVLAASVPIVATYVQFASGAEVANYGRMLYNGFDATEAASKFFVPTVLYQKFGSTTTVGVQNIETSSITARLRFFAVGNPVAVAQTDVPIPAQSSYVFSAADVTGLTPGFNGSLVITTDETGGGKVVAAAEETSDAGRAAYAFEGVAQGANTIYMPSMQCQFMTEKQTSYYAIQNAGTGEASVTITFYNTAGATIGTMPATIIPEGGKLSANPCGAGVPAGSIGSAVIQSVGAQIIAIGKVVADNGMATAFVGQSVGATSLAAPYVRWAANPSADFRAYIAVMNVGSGDATNITAKYYDGTGALVATHVLPSVGQPLPRFIKTNTNASAAGALTATYGDFGFHPIGGAIEFSSDQPIVVLARLQRTVSLGTVTMFGEDYNAIVVPAIP